ncbi:hypothetical protein [Streptomyces sp. NPDC058955]|uniref:hypothetical protein n=1 Tax=unclassified Streptomyces TaxID=2593676 RepID=UPI0036565317
MQEETGGDGRTVRTEAQVRVVLLGCRVTATSRTEDVMPTDAMPSYGNRGPFTRTRSRRRAR